MEIKANELRLGNLLTLNDKVRQELFNNEIHARNKYFKVLTIYSDGDILLELDDENVEIDIKDIEPIPLTEEWLLKLGFKRFPWGLVIGELLFKDDLKCNELTLEIGNGFRVKNKHVHQLQNLYFALTNEELIIK